MQILYKNRQLERLLTDFSALRKKYGGQAAEKIMQRISELDAAESLDDMPKSARTHPHKPTQMGKFSVDILKHKHPLRLLFYAEGDYKLEDRSTIKIIRIDEIAEIHS
jgi:proteic killer suppression protein